MTHSRLTCINIYVALLDPHHQKIPKEPLLSSHFGLKHPHYAMFEIKHERQCLETFTLPESSRQPHKDIAAAINSVNLPASVPPVVTAGEDLAELKRNTAPPRT